MNILIMIFLLMSLFGDHLKIQGQFVLLAFVCLNPLIALLLALLILLAELFPVVLGNTERALASKSKRGFAVVVRIDFQVADHRIQQMR